MSEKYTLEWFLDRLDSRDFKDIDWTSLGEASINAMIRKNGGTVDEDLKYAKADALHWHTGYQKVTEELKSVYAQLNAMREKRDRAVMHQEEQRHRAEDLEEKLDAYKDYVEALKTQVRDLKEVIEEIDQPLAADHPALVEKGKKEYSRGWDDAVSELKPEIERLKALLEISEQQLIFERTTFASDDNWTIHNLEVEKQELLDNIKHLKKIIEETREEQKHNLEIHSSDVYKLKAILKESQEATEWWKDLTLEGLVHILTEALKDGKQL